MKRLLLVMLLVGVVSPAQGTTLGEIVKYYEANPNGREWLDAHIGGIIRGFMAANGELRSNNQQRLYCPPSQLEQDPKFIVSVLKKQITEYSFLKDEESPMLSVAVLEGLKRTFPCK